MESRLRQPGWARPLAQQRHASREARSDSRDGRVASLPPLRDRSRPGSQEPLAPRSRSRAEDGSPWQEKTGSAGSRTSATRAAERLWPANHPFQEEVPPGPSA
eukprot:s501_g24.t1